MKLIIQGDEGRKTVVPLVRDEIASGRNEKDGCAPTPMRAASRARPVDGRARHLLQ